MGNKTQTASARQKSFNNAEFYHSSNSDKSHNRADVSYVTNRKAQFYRECNNKLQNEVTKAKPEENNENEMKTKPEK